MEPHPGEPSLESVSWNPPGVEVAGGSCWLEEGPGNLTTHVRAGVLLIFPPFPSSLLPPIFSQYLMFARCTVLAAGHGVRVGEAGFTLEEPVGLMDKMIWGMDSQAGESSSPDEDTEATGGEGLGAGSASTHPASSAFIQLGVTEGESGRG